jgi:hypothetical protein
VKKLRGRILPLVFLLFGFCCETSAEDPIGCPPQVSVGETVSGPFEGWSILKGDPVHKLVGLTFYDGNPAENASLAPDSETRSGNSSISSWKFSGTTSVWAVCRYADTSVTLARDLKNKIRGCSITYNRRLSVSGYPVMEKISCQ